MRQSLVVLCLAALVQPLVAQAAPDTFRLDEIVVTATKVPAPLAAVPAHVTVLSGESLRARGHTRVVDALREVSGIAVAQLGSPGAAASLFLRGGESDYVQVLLDGVQVNDPGGTYDWAHLSTADVERIEIVRGPSSVLYGSDAVAGVVQIFTRRGAGRARVRAEASGGVAERVGQHASGTFRRWTGSASVAGGARSGRGTETSYSLSAARQQSDGAYAFNNEYRNSTVAARLALATAGGTALALTTRYTDQRFHYPTDGAGHVVDHNRATFGDARSAGLTVSQPVGGRLSVHLAASAHRSDTGADDPADTGDDGFSRSAAEIGRDHLELRFDAAAAPTLTLSAGGELERQHGATDYYSDGPFGPYEDASDAERANRAAFAQLVHTGDRLGITAGGRVDHSDQFGNFATARAGVSYAPSPLVRVHAAVGSGFKEPTFLETYATGFARGNPELDPEQSRSGELGLRVARGGAHVALTAFEQRFRNLIQYTFATPTPDAPNYYNVGGAEARGLELETGAASRDVGVRGSYTYLHTSVTDAGFGEDMQFVEGEQLLRRPAHRATAALEWRARRTLTASLQASYTGARSDLDFTNPAEWQGVRVELPAYTTVAASLSVSPPLKWGALETTLHVRNLFDQRYDEVYNFPAPGRVISLGVSVER